MLSQECISVDEQSINDLTLNLEVYISYNNIPDKNKYLVLKCSLKGMYYYGQRIWVIFYIKDEDQRYDQTVLELKKAFLVIQDKSALCKHFYCTKQTVVQKELKFYLNKLELKQGCQPQ